MPDNRYPRLIITKDQQMTEDEKQAYIQKQMHKHPLLMFRVPKAPRRKPGRFVSKQARKAHAAAHRANERRSASVKGLIAGVTAFTRTAMRQTSFFETILPSVKL